MRRLQRCSGGSRDKRNRTRECRTGASTESQLRGVRRYSTPVPTCTWCQKWRTSESRPRRTLCTPETRCNEQAKHENGEKEPLPAKKAGKLDGCKRKISTVVSLFRYSQAKKRRTRNNKRRQDRQQQRDHGHPWQFAIATE